ncbi:MAG: pyridoxal phosphate-dependent aminotransferase [Euryarchaeota archaeon]|nr:pyridoxal phosphate-dependent aminotransferase [Euryarchaeota archaeon]
MRGVAESGTVRMGNLERELRARGVQVISFALGEPDFDTPAHIKEAAAEALRSGFTHYTASRGIPELRAAIAEKSARENGIPCTPDEVLVTPAKLGIYEAMMAFVGEGDEVIVPDPGWVSYGPMVGLAGGRPVNVRLREEDDFRMTPELVAMAVSPRTRMIIVNSPSNPTGTVMTGADFRGIADIARDRDLLVLSDEIYEKLVYDGRHISIASLDGMQERTITSSGFSKSYAMTGWRVGWLVAPKALMGPIDTIQQHSLTCCTSFAQKGALAALKGPQDCVTRMFEEFRRRRDYIVGRLNSSGLFECRRPSGAFYAFPRYHLKRPSLELAERLLSEAHVGLTPGSAFGAGGEGYLRISYANSMENLGKGMDAIEQAMGRF